MSNWFDEWFDDDGKPRKQKVVERCLLESCGRLLVDGKCIVHSDQQRADTERAMSNGILPLVPVSARTPQAKLAEDIAGVLAQEGVMDMMALPVAVRVMALVQSAITANQKGDQ